MARYAGNLLSQWTHEVAASRGLKPFTPVMFDNPTARRSRFLPAARLGMTGVEGVVNRKSVLAECRILSAEC
jgi:hypothetical protein